MTRVSKKFLAVLLSSAMLAAMTGCASSATADSNSTSGPAAESAAPAESADTTAETTAAASGSELSGDLDIWAWGADDEAKAREGAIEIFISEHPELNITYTIIPTADSVWDQKAAAALSSGYADES